MNVCNNIRGSKEGTASQCRVKGVRMEYLSLEILFVWRVISHYYSEFRVFFFYSFRQMKFLFFVFTICIQPINGDKKLIETQENMQSAFSYLLYRVGAGVVVSQHVLVCVCVCVFVRCSFCVIASPCLPAGSAGSSGSKSGNADFFSCSGETQQEN